MCGVASLAAHCLHVANTYVQAHVMPKASVHHAIRCADGRDLYVGIRASVHAMRQSHAVRTSHAKPS